MKKLNIIFVVLVIALGGVIAFKIRSDKLHTQQLRQESFQREQDNAERRAAAKLKAEARRPMPFNKSLFSLDDSASIWAVINKQRPLSPMEYEPLDLTVPAIPLRNGNQSQEMKLRKAAAESLEAMSTKALTSGAHLMVASAYRSYALQTRVYGNEVKNYGQATADGESARPGFSEHQSGLAVDLEPISRQCEIADCFATTIEGKWLASNSYKYGFIRRYPDDKTPVTGYRGEAWHYRYIGVDLATEMQKRGITTLEEFFALPAAPAY